MASEQQKQMNELYASIKERLANPDIDLQRVGTSRRIFTWPRGNPTRSHTLKWMRWRAGAVVHSRGLRSGSRSAAQPRRRYSRHLDAH